MSETLSTMSGKVYEITSRPDLVAMTQSRVKQATIKAHRTDFYRQDLIEQSIQFSTSSYFQALDYKSLFPLWRKPSYLRIYDATFSSPGSELVYLDDPSLVIDGYGANRTNCFYNAGAFINIRTLAAQQYFLLGYYTDPNITDLGYLSWIADEYSDVIVLEAASNVFKSIGFDEQASYLKEQLIESYNTLKINAIPGVV